MEAIIWTVVLMTAVGLIGSLLLLFASRKFAIGEDERLTYLVSILPGVNCGSCGYAGCEQYAKAMIAGAAPNACTPGGPRVADDLAAFLGVESMGVVQKEAFVACKGSAKYIDPKLDFQGMRSCRVLNTTFYSSLSCPFGCIGFGDCQEVCAFDAIRFEDGIAIIDTAACTGCGACVKICPRHVIKLVSQDEIPSIATVTCMNTMNGKKTREVCAIGCIGCMKCKKVCAFDAITVENNLAVIDDSKCTGCNSCIEACPTNSISPLVFQ